MVEVMVVMALMAVMAVVFMKFMTSAQGTVVREDLRNQTFDQARLAMDELDREIRSGSIIYNPSLDDSINCGGYTCTADMSLRIYTQTNGSTRSPSNQCVQWLLTTNDQLLRRAWAQGATQSLSGWRVVATGIVNRDPAANGGASYDIFWLNNQPATIKTVEIQVAANANKSDPRSPTVFLQNAVSIRNYGSGDPCSPIPTAP
jgi:type II secretory pathway pseudopilin PulG